MTGWKESLYESYVSSGQAGNIRLNASEHFGPRRSFLSGLIRRHIPPDRDLHILDIGCGHGALLYFLHLSGYRNLRGVDESAEQVALAGRLGVPGVTLGAATDFLRSIDSESVDVVLLIDVIEHLDRTEMWELLQEVRRVLRFRGRVIVHVPNAGGLFGMEIRFGDLTHEQAFTSTSLSQLFRAAGFSDITCFEDKPLFRGVVRCIRRILWDFGTLPIRLLHAAETGTFHCILSSGLLAVATR